VAPSNAVKKNIKGFQRDVMTRSAFFVSVAPNPTDAISKIFVSDIMLLHR
jgi:hypothetical protein